MTLARSLLRSLATTVGYFILGILQWIAICVAVSVAAWLVARALIGLFR
jgi:hypothetical protein